MLYFTIFTFILSCRTEQNVDNEIMNCLMSKIDEGSEINSDIFLKNLKQMEKVLIDEGYLNDLDKEGYVNLIKNISSKNKNDLILLTDTLDDKIPYFKNLSLSLVTFWYKACLFEFLNDNSEANSLRKRIEHFQKLEMSGFNNTQLLVSYIDVVNFNNKKDRLFLLCLIYNHIYNR